MALLRRAAARPALVLQRMKRMDYMKEITSPERPGVVRRDFPKNPSYAGCTSLAVFQYRRQINLSGEVKIKDAPGPMAGLARQPARAP